MKSTEDICMELENIPYMKFHQAEIIKNLITKNGFKNAIEVGFYHGKSSVLIASIFEEIGEGHLTTLDLESARGREPNILQLLDDYNLSHRVTPVFCERSYTWELSKVIRETNEPIYDFCYLDGGHTWDFTGFGFFLIDMLLKPGGIIIFDDMNWTISNSPSYKNALIEGKDPFAQYSEDEKNTPAVRMVMQELVSARGYICKEIKEVQWGVAEKLKGTQQRPDQNSSCKTAIPTSPADGIKEKSMIQQRGVDFFSDLRKYLPAFHPKTIFDVGANIGQSSLLYAKEFPGSQLYCFEPISTTFQQLQHNIKFVPGCHCFNLGFSSKEGPAEMISNIEHSTRSRIKQKNDRHKDNSTVEHVDVHLDTLDRFCEQHNIKEIDLLKIDAEGHDLEVLKGGSSLLRDGKVNVVMVEAGMNKDNNLHVPFTQLYEYLQNLGYYLFAFYEQKEEWINKMPHLRRSNPVFIRHMRKHSHDEKNDLRNALEGKNWGRKYDIYKDLFEGISYQNLVPKPTISIIVISWRLHPDNLRNFQILEKQRDQNFELIFVDNGGKTGEFEALKPFINKYVRLNTNTGAYLARNMGAVFARAPLLLFLEDDCIPSEHLVSAHLQAYSSYDIICARGVYVPKTENPLNKKASHYYLGPDPFPIYPDTEGNFSIKLEPFFKVGGWDDRIRFGGGGVELSRRLFEIEPELRKQIYLPSAEIFHDYASNEDHLAAKISKQVKSRRYIKAKHPDYDKFIDMWKPFWHRSKTLYKTGPDVSAPISVVIPTYNRSRYIKEAIFSAINQTVPPREVIVVDDGSTDDTQEIVSRIKSNKIRYIKKEHTCAPDTRNHAIAKACSEYILWLDSDDVLLPDAIEKYQSVMKMVPDADVYYGNLLITNDDMVVQQKLIYEDWHDRNNDLVARILMSNSVPNPGTLVRTSCYYRFGVYEKSFTRAHDYEFWCRISKSAKFKHVGSFVCKWRWHDSNMSSGSVKIDFSYDARVAKGMLARYTIRELFPGLDWAHEEQSLSIAYIIIGNIFHRYEDYIAALEHYSKSLEILPSEDCYIKMGAVYIKTRQFGKARDAFEHALALNPDNQQSNNILQYLESASRLESNNSTMALGGKGRHATTLPNHSQGTTKTTVTNSDATLLEKISWDEMRYTLHGEELYETGDERGAFEAFSMAIAMNPQYAKAYNNLGVLHWKGGNNQAALDHFRTALSLDNDDLDTVLNMGELLISLDRGNETAQIIQNYLSSHPGNIEVQEMLSRTRSSDTWGMNTIPQLSDPMVSVIVPTYNRPEMLRNAIQSVLEQSYQNYEIIVVNDCGQDIDDIVTELNEISGKIVSVRHTVNKGLAAARNTGIKHARGKYIACLDDDDIFYSDHLETAVGELKESQGVVYTNAVRATYRNTGKGYVLLKKDVPYSIDYDRNKLLLGNISPVNCFVFERELAIKTGLFDETLTTLEDWDFWIRLSLLSPFKHIPNATVQVNWRTDGSTMTSSRQSEFMKNREAIYARNRAEICKIPNTQEIMAEFQRIWAQDCLELPDPNAPMKAVKPGLVSIIILTFNQLKYTKQCVKSIDRYTPEPHEIIFVDNGSSDRTQNFLRKYAKKHERVELILNDENKGFAGGSNQGIAKARGEYILLLNNDVVVTKGWLGTLVGHLEQSPDVGMVGPMSNSVSGPQWIMNTLYGNSMEAMHRFAQDFSASNAGKSTDLMRLVGFCLLIRKSVIEVIGGLDENYRNGNYEDDDLCLRSLFAGYRNIMAGDVFIHHYGSATFKGNNMNYGESINENREYFANKWKGIVEVDGQQYTVRVTREAQIKKLLTWGEEYYFLGDTASAVKIFRRILQLDRTNAQALNNLGVIQWQTGDIDSAMETFKIALSHNPGDADVLANLTQAVNEKGRLDLLEENLLHPLEKADPMNPTTLQSTGIQQKNV